MRYQATPSIKHQKFLAAEAIRIAGLPKKKEKKKAKISKERQLELNNAYNKQMFFRQLILSRANKIQADYKAELALRKKR